MVPLKTDSSISVMIEVVLNKARAKETMKDLYYLKLRGKESFGKVILMWERATICYYAMEDPESKSSLPRMKLLTHSLRYGPAKHHVYLPYHLEVCVPHSWPYALYDEGNELFFHLS